MRSLESHHKLLPQLKDKQLRKNPSRLIGLVRDYLEGNIDREIINSIKQGDVKLKNLTHRHHLEIKKGMTEIINFNDKHNPVKLDNE